MKAKNPNLPQIKADQALYGEIPLEMLPTPPVSDQSNPDLVVPVYDQVNQEWVFARIIGGGGMDIVFSAEQGTIEVFYADNRVYATFSADATLFKTNSGTFTADALLV
jgi:hypothetical protein